MPKISDARRAERRTQILEAAWACFQRQGLQGTTMDDIIRASGLSAGAVYGYFKSKDELIATGLDAAMTGLRDALLPTLVRQPPLPLDMALKEIAETILNFSRHETYDRRRIHILGLGEAQRNAAFGVSLRTYYLGFRSQLEKIAPAWLDPATEQPNADVSAAVAKTLMSLMLGFVVQSVILDDVSPDDLANGLHALGLPELE